MCIRDSNDPLVTIKNVYIKLGLDIDIQTENRMKKYLLGQNEIKKQKHIYSLEDFGLNEEKINVHLENYIMNNNF